MSWHTVTNADGEPIGTEYIKDDPERMLDGEDDTNLCRPDFLLDECHYCGVTVEMEDNTYEVEIDGRICERVVCVNCILHDERAINEVLHLT